MLSLKSGFGLCVTSISWLFFVLSREMLLCAPPFTPRNLRLAGLRYTSVPEIVLDEFNCQGASSSPSGQPRHPPPVERSVARFEHTWWLRRP